MRSGESTEESSEESIDATPDVEDVQKIFGLSARDLTRGREQITLNDLKVRQLAFSMAATSGRISPTELLATGGEADARPHLAAVFPLDAAEQTASRSCSLLVHIPSFGAHHSSGEPHGRGCCQTQAIEKQGQGVQLAPAGCCCDP